MGSVHDSLFPQLTSTYLAVGVILSNATCNETDSRRRSRWMRSFGVVDDDVGALRFGGSRVPSQRPRTSHSMTSALKRPVGVRAVRVASANGSRPIRRLEGLDAHQ